ncbi:recombinase family protein [Patescibacteria group bacterium]|nr:recombinase family protein [Patescibacteria group bacterium]
MKNEKQKCIIYCRVSTPKQSKEGESLDIQENICRSVAEKQNLEVVKIFREAFSGRKDYRPVYNEMIEFIKKSFGINKLIIRTLDRFTRDGSFSYEHLKKELEDLGVSLIDSVGIIQPAQNSLGDLGFEYDWSVYSPSQTSENIISEQGKMEVRNILTRVVSQSIRLTQKGFKLRGTNDGYISQKIYVKGKKRYIQVPDPERQDYIIEMFKLRATGQYTDQEVADKINAQGYKTRIKNKWDIKKENIIGTIGGNKLSVKRLQDMIKNSIYCGVMCEKWTHYKPINAAYDGLISIDLFNKANRGKVFIKEKENDELEILYDYIPIKKIQKRNKNNPLYPFKNVILCPECRKAFLGSAPRGKSGKKHPTYHCSRKGHQYFGIPKQEFENNVKKFVRNLNFTKNFFEDCKFLIIKKYKDKLKKVTRLADSVGRNVKNLEIKKQSAIQVLITTKSELVRYGIETEIEKIENEIQSMTEYKEEVRVDESDISKFIGYAKYLMEHKEEMLVNTSETANIQRQQSLFGLLFKQFPTYAEILNGTPQLSLILETKNTHS